MMDGEMNNEKWEDEEEQVLGTQTKERNETDLKGENKQINKNGEGWTVRQTETDTDKNQQLKNTQKINK